MASVEEIRYNCNKLILALVGGDKELADLWWTTNNKYFSGITPNEVFEYNPESVLNYLLSHAYG